MQPTIGRRLWFFMTANQVAVEGLTKLSEQPFDAGVIHVNNDGTVNLQVTDHAGTVETFHSVTIVTEPEDHGHPYWAEWMPYQKQQAEKQELPSVHTNSTLVQQSKAWLAVAETLDSCAPGWLSLGPSAMDAACAQIQQFASNEEKSKSLLNNLPQGSAESHVAWDSVVKLLDSAVDDWRNSGVNLQVAAINTIRMLIDNANLP